MDMANVQDLTVTFYEWNRAKRTTTPYLVVKVTGPEESCTATQVSGTESGADTFKALMSGKTWFGQIEDDFPDSKGLFDPTNRKHWRTLRIIFRSAYDHVSLQEGLPA
jgi:hypothetical protein